MAISWVNFRHESFWKHLKSEWDKNFDFKTPELQMTSPVALLWYHSAFLLICLQKPGGCRKNEDQQAPGDYGMLEEAVLELAAWENKTGALGRTR